MSRVEDHRAGRGRSEHSWHAFRAPTNYVFILKGSAERFMAAEIVKRTEEVGSRLRADVVMLVDHSERIQAILDEAWLASARLPMNIDIYAFVLTPGLGNRLAPKGKERALGSGLCELELPSSISVGPRFSADDVFRTIAKWFENAEDDPRNLSAFGITRSGALVKTPPHNDVSELIGLRKRLRETVPMIDSDQWAQWRGVSSNPSATLAKYREQGRLFAVREGRNYLYPKFQFTADAFPLDAIADVLGHIPDDARGWPLLSWFETPSRLLGRRKPSEVLAEDPAAVRDAAADFYSDD